MSDGAQAVWVFLFTDVEGSSALWEQDADGMRKALAEQERIIREAIEGSGGKVFKTVGDAFCAVFGSAENAVSAALAAQRALAAPARGADFTRQKEEVQAEAGAPRADGAPAAAPTILLRVRMAVHAGAADEQGGDYFGPTLNRTARILAIAYGGQVLVSQAVVVLIRDALPQGASLKDLGEHRLRDLSRPERLYQLFHPELPADFPPLKSLSVLPHNLPHYVTSFVGRQKQIATLEDLLTRHRLVTLTGPGGTGKTRLALQACAELVSGDGVWLVDLSALTDPRLVPQEIASVFHLKEEPRRPLLLTLLDYLESRRLLLILDNCEHLVEACAAVCDAVLKRCPDVRLMVTSREPLGISGEQILRVPSLTVPPPSAFGAPPAGVTAGIPAEGDPLVDYEAVRLFVDRARAVSPDFALSQRNTPAIARICTRLDGIPLAIELAAARVRMLSPEQILERLDDRFRLLTGGSRTALERHQTLRATVDWSHQLLSEEEKTLFRRLAVFNGGFTLDAAEAVCAQRSADFSRYQEQEARAQAGAPHAGVTLVPRDAVMDLLTHLVDKSLVVFDDAAEPPRYRLLETLHAYAREKLDESGEGIAMREAHLAHFTEYAEAAEPELTGANQLEWLARLEAEHDNFRAALDFASTAGFQPEDSAERSADFSRYKEEGPASAGGAPPGVARHALGLRMAKAIARFWLVRGYLAEGRERLKALLSAPGAEPGADFCRHEEQALASAGATAGVLRWAGQLAYRQSDYAEATQLLDRALILARKADNRKTEAFALNDLGIVAGERGDYARAQDYFEQALAIRREIGDKWGIASSLGNLGTAAWERGDYARAQDYFEQALAIWREIGDKRGIAWSLEAFALLAAAQASAGTGEADLCRRAVILFAAADALRKAIGAPNPPDERRRYDEALAQCRAVLGEEGYARAYAEGSALPPDAAITLALRAS